MAYVEVSEAVLVTIAGQLTDGQAQLARYRTARDKWRSYQAGYNAAYKEYEEASREVADGLLKLSQSIVEVEQHKRGMAW